MLGLNVPAITTCEGTIIYDAPLKIVPSVPVEPIDEVLEKMTAERRPEDEASKETEDCGDGDQVLGGRVTTITRLNTFLLRHLSSFNSRDFTHIT